MQPTAVSHLPWDPKLAHLRGLAALIVLVFHVFHTFFWHSQPQPRFSGLGWIVEGHTGVTLFFVLSGYLFMSISVGMNGAIDYFSFLRNRILRIFPLYIVFFVVAISIGRDAFRPMDFLYVIFSNMGLAPTSNQFITGAAWTIGVELGFYMVFPFLARFALDQGPGYLPRVVLLLLLLKWGAYSMSDRPTLMIYSTLLGRLDQFLIGMWAAQLVKGVFSSHLRTGLHGGFLFAAAFGMWAALEAQSLWASFFMANPVQIAWVLWPTFEALMWSLLLVTYSSWRGSFGVLIEKVLARAGEISFSIYLWHALVIHALERALGDLWPHWLSKASWPVWAVVFTLAVLAVTWVIATLSYETIERPFTQLRRRYGSSTSENAPEHATRGAHSL